MEIVDELESLYNLRIKNFGGNRAKVFSLVRKVTGMSVKDVKQLLDSKERFVAKGTKMELDSIMIEFEEIGVDLELIPL